MIINEKALEMRLAKGAKSNNMLKLAYMAKFT